MSPTLNRSLIPMPTSSQDDSLLDPLLRDAGPTTHSDAMDVNDTPTAIDDELGGQDMSLSARARTHNEERERNIANNKAMLLGLGINKALAELDMVMGKPGKENYRASEKPKPKVPAKTKSSAGGRKHGGKKKGTLASGNVSPEDLEPAEQINKPSSTVTHSVPAISSNSTADLPRRMTRSGVKSTWVNTDVRLKVVSPDQRKWMKPAVEALVEVLGPVQENGMVDLWLKFETLMGHQDLKKKLTAEGRPWQLSDWLTRGRKYQSPPPIDKAPAYASTWREWWSLIQPDWRTDGVTWPMLKKDVEDEKWTDAMKGGMNGIFLAILSVSWWYAQCGAGDERNECKEAILDICWVLERMIKVRKTCEEESDRPAKRYVPNLGVC